MTRPKQEASIAYVQSAHGALSAESYRVRSLEKFASPTAVYRRRGGETTLVASPSGIAAAEEALGELAPQSVLPRVPGGARRPARRLSTTRAGIRVLLGGGPKLSSRDLGFPDEVTAAVRVGPAAEVARSTPRAAWLARTGVDPTLTVRYGS